MTLYYDPKTQRAKLVIYAGLDARGRQRQRTKTWQAPNERQARREAAKHESTIRDEVEQKVERSKTVNGLVDEWQHDRDAQDSPTSIKGRKAILRRIRKGLGQVRLDELSARHVSHWMTDMRSEGLTDTTIANHHSQLRAILRQGEDWDMVTDRPTKKAKPPRKQHRRPTPPTSAAVDVLVDSASPDLRMCAEIAAEVGMRRGEVLGLRWSDIDVAAKVVNVNRALIDQGEGRWGTKLPKSGQTRVVPVSDDFLGVLERHRARQSSVAALVGKELGVDGWVIADLAVDQTGQMPRKVDWLSRAWMRHRKRNGSTSTFHDLRHWSASELIDAGVPITVVQKRLGHLQLSTTQNVYSHSVATSEQEAADVISIRRGRRRTPELSAPQ